MADGDASSPQEASALIQRHGKLDYDQRLADNERRWRGFLDTIQVETPDKAFDAMVNHWLPYQALACRIRARSAFYQASGAFGFRDQLQDTMALLSHDPALGREQILNAAGRQFAEGDVQHWWLPRTGAGVRTIISDDVVWLAHAVARYVSVTGDKAILKEKLPFIEGRRWPRVSTTPSSCRLSRQNRSRFTSIARVRSNLRSSAPAPMACR